MNHDLDQPLNIDNQICFALYDANKRFNKFYSEILAEFKLTYPQYLVLSTLWDAKDGQISMRELGNCINLDSGTLTPLLKRLEQHGWISRQKDRDDERHVIVKLTTAAEQKRALIVSKVKNGINRLDLPKKDYQKRVDEINDITRRLDSIIPEIYIIKSS